MSGHFATLLRDTVRTAGGKTTTCYVTDWHNVRDVPLARPAASAWTSTCEHVIAVHRPAMGPGSHVMAVCQPCVSALAAVALMSEDGTPGHVPATPDPDGRPDRLPREPDAK